MTFKVYDEAQHKVLYDGADQAEAMAVIEKTKGNLEFRVFMPSPGHISQKDRGTTSQGCIVASQQYVDGRSISMASLALSDRDIEKINEAAQKS